MNDTLGRKNPEFLVNVHWRDKRNEIEGKLKHSLSRIRPLGSFRKHSSDPRVPGAGNEDIVVSYTRTTTAPGLEGVGRIPRSNHGAELFQEVK